MAWTIFLLGAFKSLSWVCPAPAKKGRLCNIELVKCLRSDRNLVGLDPDLGFCIEIQLLPI